MVYAVSDLHGYPFEKFEKLLEAVGFSDDDFLYVLGDVIDRGKDGIRILNWLTMQPNVQFILGNHEAMMLTCAFLFEEITEESINNLGGGELNTYSTWLNNGGQPTVDALYAMEQDDREYLFEYLREAPLYDTATVNGRDFVFTHSGLGSFRKDKKLSEYSATDLLWNRPGLNRSYFDDITVIFGHTPTECYGPQYAGRIIINDTWINIDAGAGIGHNIALFRLDDMRVFYSD